MSALSHLRQDGTGRSLTDHAVEVATLAASFASVFGEAEAAYLLGLWHDLGKFLPAFQQRLRRVVGGLTAAAVDHAWVGEHHGRPLLGHLAALIGHHHGGLPDGDRIHHRSFAPDPRLLDILRDVDAALLSGDGAPSPLATRHRQHLRLLMLYSTLVDADYLSAELFLRTEQGLARDSYPSIAELLIRHETERIQFESRAAGSASKVNQLRQRIYRRCVTAASELPPGSLTLTVPTGGGKTRAFLGFGLHHAAHWGKRRVVVALPYMSIVEQTAEVYRGILGEQAVVEHHSGLDPERESEENRLAAENWDAPVIVTTMVQLLESLFSNKPSRCRKLHNLADSVLVLDEAQLLPLPFLLPIVHRLQELVEDFGVTLVIATATQPALDKVRAPEADRDYRAFRALGKLVEILNDPKDPELAPARLHEHFRRVRVEFPRDLSTPTPWAELATDLARCERVLAVVDRRDAARELHALMPAGTYHLSAAMCGGHRSDTIRDIKLKLASRGEAVRLVSTQLIEAGVDLDFDTVYRSLTCLASIAQAFGRCNREGRLTEGLGRVFVPPCEPPKALHLQRSGTKALLGRGLADVLSPAAFRTYFAEIYGLKGARRLDEAEVLPDVMRLNCATVAEKFQLIDDHAVPVLVRYSGPAGSSDPLFEALLRDGAITRHWLRRAQRFIVTITPAQAARLEKQGKLREAGGILLQCDPDLYDPVLGLRYE